MNVHKLSKKAPFAVGDKVTTDFNLGEERVVRTVTECLPKPDCQSLWVISTNAGKMCPLCRKPAGRPTYRIDAAWFKRVPPAPKVRKKKTPTAQEEQRALYYLAGCASQCAQDARNSAEVKQAFAKLAEELLKRGDESTDETKNEQG